MNKITLNTAKQKSEIFVGCNWTDALEIVPEGRTVIITDANVNRIYGSEFRNFPVIIIEPGETSKSISTIAVLASKLLETGIDRKGFILGAGGGVVCDIAGFLASVYMRGIKFGFVSTTLLSQVDASVGGKNGVNLQSVKNIIGTFNQPQFVMCDPSMLKTLPRDEFLSGLAELVKMGAILSEPLLGKIERNSKLILERDPAVMESLIFDSVKLKARIVKQDEREAGVRMVLNFGHTFGHIIETVAGINHGFAVAEGMKIAASISVSEGLLSEAAKNRLNGILEGFGLKSAYGIESQTFEKMLATDKKKSGTDVSFVLLEKPGKAVIRKIPLIRLAGYIKEINAE